MKSNQVVQGTQPKNSPWLWQDRSMNDSLPWVEYKLSPNWFFSIQDMYNYGNPDKPHYYSFSFGISKNTSRLSLTAGKQRAGLFCVGGVCREVPASNGFSISLTSSF